MSLVIAHTDDSRVLIGGENHWRLADGSVVTGPFKCRRIGKFVLGLLGHSDGFHNVFNVAANAAVDTLAEFLKVVIPATYRQKNTCVAVIAGMDANGNPKVISGGVLWDEAIAFTDAPPGWCVQSILHNRALDYLKDRPGSWSTMFDAFSYLATQHRECGPSARLFVVDANGARSIDPTEAMGAFGSLVSFPANNFSYSATSTSITWSWTTFNIYLPDGSTITVPSGSAPAFTGLSSSTTYHFGFYVTVSGPTVHVAKSTQSSGTAKETLQVITQTYQADGNVCINVDATAATPGSGTSGGGGGSGTCFSPNTLVVTAERGEVPIGQVKSGNRVLTAKGTWCEVETVTTRSYDGEALDMGNGEIVTPRHHFLTESGWKHVGDLGRYPWVWYTGTIHNLHIKTDDPDEHSYTLANGEKVHNFLPT